VSLAGALGKLVNLTSLNLGCTWNVECLFVCQVKCVVRLWLWAAQLMMCGCAAWVGAPGTGLGGRRAAAALAGALSKLVNLTSLGLECAWTVGSRLRDPICSVLVRLWRDYD